MPKTKNLEFQYTLKGQTLEDVSSTPYLSVCLSETLEREAHIKELFNCKMRMVKCRPTVAY